jgi:hypothetical protein
MPTVLDNFIVLFGESGAKKLEKTIDNIGKAVVNSVNKSIAAHKTLERHRNNSIKNLTDANKLRHKLAQEASKIEERTLRKTVPLEEQLVNALKRRERLEKAISELSKNTVDYQRKRVELAKINEKIVGIQTKLNTINAKKEKEAAKEAERRQKALEKEQEKKDQAEARARKNAAREKLNDFKAWRREYGLAAKEKRLEAGREWVETKRITKKKGRERGKRIAIQRKAKEAREEERKRLADEKERTRLENASLAARASNIRKIASFFGLSRGAMLAGAWGAGILGAGMLAKGTWDFTKGRVHSRVKNALSYLGTGTEPKYAVGLDKELYGYGGEKGEAIQLLSQLSAGIGSMRYGDTSLVQTLGTFGISGIGAHSKSKDILRSVWQRAQGMDEEEREAMFNALGFSQGVKNFMRKGSLSEIDLDAAVSKWEETDSETLKSMYDVENTIQKKVEEIASGVGKIVKWFEDFFNGDKKVAPNPESNPYIQAPNRKHFYMPGGIFSYPIPVSQNGDIITTTNNYYATNNNYGGYFSDNGSDANINLEMTV